MPGVVCLPCVCTALQELVDRSSKVVQIPDAIAEAQGPTTLAPGLVVIAKDVEELWYAHFTATSTSFCVLSLVLLKVRVESYFASCSCKKRAILCGT